MNFHYLEKRYNVEKARQELTLVVLLPGKGCAWVQQTNGEGCNMCGFKHILAKVNSEQFFSSLMLESIVKDAIKDTIQKKPEALVIYNGGSFLNPSEIFLEAQEKILEGVVRHPTIQSIIVESRPEFVTAEKISRYVSILGTKKLKVAIGLECVDDELRRKFINKGFSKADYDYSGKMIIDNGGQLSTYVFVKPLGLADKDAIDEAIETAKYAFSRGSHVLLSCAFIQEGTKMANCYHRKEYKPPWLWTIIEIVKRLHNLGQIHIGSFHDEPQPVAIPQNYGCGCSEEVENALWRYNLTRDISLLKNLSCKCQRVWREEVSISVVA